MKPASTSTTRASRSMRRNFSMRFTSTTSESWPGRIAPHTPLPAPNGTMAMPRSEQ